MEALEGLRLELLKLKTDLQRELGTFALTCRARSLDVCWAAGIGRPARTLGASGPRAARRAGQSELPMQSRRAS
jgi:hypothetical protein